jgi:hypothetical protein
VTATNIVQFVPKAQATAEANLQAFVETAKPILGSYPNVRSWDENNWDLRGAIERSGHGDHRIACAFGDFESSRRSSRKGSARAHSGWMSEPFLSFAKAYILYVRSINGSLQIANALAALRALEKALVDTHGESAPHRTGPLVCNRAANLIQERYTDAAAYGVGKSLEAVTAFISEHWLAPPFQWKSSIRHAHNLKNRVGNEADEARKKALPSQAALEALPKCFNMAVEVRDVVATSIAALLCTSPDRIGEVFCLPADCEVTDTHDGKVIYGLRWFPEKGSEPTIKWIAPSMVDVAKSAVANLRRISEPARKIAAWYEKNSGKLYLLPDKEYLRKKELISFRELGSIFGSKEKGSAILWAGSNKIRRFPEPGGGRRLMVRYDEVEQVICSMLPVGFPIIDSRTKLKYSEALIVVRKNELNLSFSPYDCMIEPISSSQFNQMMGGSPAVSSVFDRFGFTEPDGSRIRVSSHQFRHWLNTLAHRGGMSQIDIAKWSGRKDIRQNEAYDNRSPDEMLEMVRAMTETDPRLFGGLAELVKKAPVSRDEFMQLEFPTAHVTDIGFCVHDFTVLPCEKHRDCLNCNEHVCIKGDRTKTARIKGQLELAETQLEKAQDAIAQGYFGAERWLEHHEMAVERLRNLVGILDDPAVPDGSVIRLTNDREFSPVRLAMQDRLAIEDENSEEFLQLQALLGDA